MLLQALQLVEDALEDKMHLHFGDCGGVEVGYEKFRLFRVILIETLSLLSPIPHVIHFGCAAY